MSLLEYYDMIQPLREHNFDKLTMMKWRNLFMTNCTLGSITLFGSLLPGYLGAKFLIGPFLHGPAI